MDKENNWYNFYKPYIDVKKMLDVKTILENYIRRNYSKLIVEQFERYKEERKYSKAGDFIENEIKSGLKNPASYYSELKKGNKKNISDILPKIEKLPILLDYVKKLESDEKNRTILRDTLELGKLFMERPECCHFLLWTLSTTANEFGDSMYTSDHLFGISIKIIKNHKNFKNYDENSYSIALDEYRNFLDIEDFLTKESVLDLYIKLNYPKILKDAYKIYKNEGDEIKANYNQNTFMVDNKLYNGDDNGRYLYTSLVKGRKKLDYKLLKEFRNLPILQENSDSYHSKEIDKLNHIRFALKMGALAYETFPYLLIDITSAMERAKLKGYEELYLTALSEELEKVSFDLRNEEISIEYEYWSND